MALSPKEIQLIIDKATNNPQSLVEWLGSGGMKELLTAMNNNAVLRGVAKFADKTSMSLAGGTDSEFAVCHNGTTGVSFYGYYSNNDPSVVGGVTSVFGGQWRPILDGSSTYIYSINPAVASIDAEIVVTIPLTQPTATYFVTIEPENPYAAAFLIQGYYISSKTTTSFRIKLAAAIGVSGTFLANIKLSY